MLPTRGGWGSARLLPHLDFDTIRRNPKVILGYSDITALLNGIHARTGLVTFHGPEWRRPLGRLVAGLDEAGAVRRRGGDVHESEDDERSERADADRQPDAQ